MKKSAILFLFSFIVLSSTAAKADINVNIGINGIPSVSVSADATVVLIPDTPDVYFVDNSQEDIFLWNGFWWKSMNGKWFKSESANSGWQVFVGTPQFFNTVKPDWRKEYKSGKWNGKPWRYEKVPYGHMKKGKKDKGHGKEKGHKKD